MPYDLGIHFYSGPNEPVGKVSFLKSASSAGSKIRNYCFVLLKLLYSLMQCSYSSKGKSVQSNVEQILPNIGSAVPGLLL
jgi:hypothetical protein